MQARESPSYFTRQPSPISAYLSTCFYEWKITSHCLAVRSLPSSRRLNEHKALRFAHFLWMNRVARIFFGAAKLNENLTASQPSLSQSRMLSVDLKFITPRVFGFYLKSIFQAPPQNVIHGLTGWLLLPRPLLRRSLDEFCLISSRCTPWKSLKLHRLMPLITLDV